MGGEVVSTAEVVKVIICIIFVVFMIYSHVCWYLIKRIFIYELNNEMTTQSAIERSKKWEKQQTKEIYLQYEFGYAAHKKKKYRVVQKRIKTSWDFLNH